MTEPPKTLGRPIYNLQTMLRLISQTDSRVLPVIPDGIYGANTYAAVRSYQEIYALNPTGEVNLDTWSHIVADYEMALSSIRDTDRLILIQAMLNTISEYYSAIPSPIVNGKINKETTDGLRLVQKYSELTENGLLTPETQAAVLALYSSIP